MTRTAAVPLEPTPEALTNPVRRYLLATRPAFLSITLAGCLLGFATAPGFDWGLALLTLLLALFAHAGVNVLNDYYDHLNGTDAANTQRLFPFTGGSRFIQNGVLTPLQMLAWGLILFGAVIAGGLWLIGARGVGLFWIGLAGLVIGWAYSAPPLRLNSRGLGEACVAAGFLLIVAGADFVQRGEFAPLPWLAGLPYALLVTNILYINQFPDREADALAGKRHWVVRLAPATAARGYALILALAALTLVGLCLAGALPKAALIALAGMLPGLGAARALAQHATAPAQLAPAIQATIAAAHLHAVLLAALLTLF
ncbi:MAG: prenyltransferase [Betaproteobacteria bacterium]|nr:prenyltransferase [Betaproteobacteria bacterium]